MCGGSDRKGSCGSVGSVCCASGCGGGAAAGGILQAGAEAAASSLSATGVNGASACAGGADC